MKENLPDYESISEDIENLVIDNQGFTSIADLLKRRYSPKILRYEEASWEEGTHIKTPKMKIDPEKLDRDLSRISRNYPDNPDEFRYLTLNHSTGNRSLKISINLEKYSEELFLELGAHEGNEEIEIKNSEEVEEVYGNEYKSKDHGRSNFYRSFPVQFLEGYSRSKTEFPSAFNFLFSNSKLRGVKKAYSEIMDVSIGDISFEKSDLEYVRSEEWLENNLRVAIRYPLRILLASDYLEKENPSDFLDKKLGSLNPLKEPETEEFSKENSNGRKLYLPTEKRKEAREALEEEWNEIENIPFSFIGGDRTIEGVLDATRGMKDKFGDKFVKTLRNLKEWGEGRLEERSKKELRDNFKEEKEFKVVEKYMNSLLEDEGWMERNKEFGANRNKKDHIALTKG